MGFGIMGKNEWVMGYEKKFQGEIKFKSIKDFEQFFGRFVKDILDYYYYITDQECYVEEIKIKVKDIKNEEIEEELILFKV